MKKIIFLIVFMVASMVSFSQQLVKLDSITSSHCFKADYIYRQQGYHKNLYIRLHPLVVYTLFRKHHKKWMNDRYIGYHDGMKVLCTLPEGYNLYGYKYFIGGAGFAMKPVLKEIAAP